MDEAQEVAEKRSALMATVFPAQGAEMSFEHERYPIFLVDDSVSDVIAEQQRVLDASLPIRGMQLIQGALVNMGQNFDPIGRAVVELLVDTSGNPELRAMLNAVRKSPRPLDIRVFAQWTMTRSQPHWLALLYMNLEHDTLGVARYHLAFDMRDADARAMLSRIERTRQITIVDASGVEPQIYRVAALPTSAIDLATGKTGRSAGVVERLRGLMLEVPSSLINAFSYSDLFKLAVRTSDLEIAWPRLLHLDTQMLEVEAGGDFAPPPLDKHDALIATKHVGLYLSYCSWFGNPMDEGFGNVRFLIDRGVSAVALEVRGGWQQLALRGENIAWLPPYGVPSWEIVLAWRSVSGDAFSMLIEGLRHKFDVVPVDLAPMLFYIGQMARLNDLAQARAWIDAVQYYEIGLMPLIPALIEMWAAHEPARRHHPALSAIQLSDDLQARVKIVQALLVALQVDLSWIQRIEIEHMDGAILRAIEQLARHIWQIDARGIIRQLLDSSEPDLAALTGIGLLDSLVVASAWLPDPPNPLALHLIPAPLMPFSWFQHQLLQTFKLPIEIDALRYLTHDMVDTFADPSFRHRTLPFQGVERDNRPNAEREEQIGAAMFWLHQQVTAAEAKGTARPAAGRFEVEVPTGFDELTRYGVQRLRILALDGVLLIRLILREGGLIVPWLPSTRIPAEWRMLMPETLIWELSLFLSAVYRDIRVEGRDQVLISAPQERAPALPREKGRGRPATNLLPRFQVERVRLGRGFAPLRPSIPHEWSTAEEREYIQKRKHGVKGRVVRLPDGWRASDVQRALVAELQLPDLPECGLTYRKPHTRGTDTPHTVAKPIRAKGLLIAMGVLDSIRQERKDTEA
jgi:hypothetical protein